MSSFFFFCFCFFTVVAPLKHCTNQIFPQFLIVMAEHRNVCTWRFENFPATNPALLRHNITSAFNWVEGDARNASLYLMTVPSVWRGPHHPLSLSFPLSLSPFMHWERAGEGVIVVWLVTWPYRAEEHGGSGGGEVWRGYRWGSSGGNRVGQAAVEWSNPTWHHSAPNSVCIPLRVLLIPVTLLLNSLSNFSSMRSLFRLSHLSHVLVYIYIYI